MYIVREEIFCEEGNHSINLFIVLLLTMTVSITPGLADAGNFSSDSDWGGGGGSSSWGSSSSWDDDYSSSSGGMFSALAILEF